MSMYYGEGKDDRSAADIVAATKVVCTAEEGKTKQSFADEVNINSMVERYQRTGMLDHVEKNPGVFADVSKIGDYRQLVSTITDAKDTFMKLSPVIRKRFQNDPGELIDFMSDPGNRDEAIKLGLVSKAAPVPKLVKASEEPVVEPPKEASK